MIACAVAIPMLALAAIEDAGRLVAALVFGVTALAMFVTSVVYHAARRPALKQVLRKLDHSAIYLLIAGTYTPVCLLALDGWWGVSLLIAVWVGALVGIVLKVVGLERYRKVSAPLALVQR